MVKLGVTGIFSGSSLTVELAHGVRQAGVQFSSPRLTMKTSKVIGDLVAEYKLIWEKGKSRELPDKVWNKGVKGDVLLIQGWRERIPYLLTLGNYLNQLGYRVHYLAELENNTLPIIDTVKIAEKYMHLKNIKSVVLITHSKGGVVAKYLVDYSADANRIKKVIAIAAPFKGSWGANLLRFQNCFELATNSEIINKINLMKINNHKIVSIFPAIDNHVIPNKNCILEGATNIQVNVVGHTRILESEEVRKIIQEYL